MGKLCVITDLSLMPWIDGTTARPTVLLKVAVHAVRSLACGFTAIFNPPDLPAKRQLKQDQMMPALLRYMAEGMRGKIMT